MKKMSNKIRVFEKGDFYDEANEKDIPEREFHDCNASYVVQDRAGRIGIVTASYWEYYVHWIDEDDPAERFRIEREEIKASPGFEDFQDKRGRTWEWFIDSSHFDCTCVRLKGETDFNSPLSFHFNTPEIAEKFVELLKQAS